MEVELTREQALGKQLVLTRYVKFTKANSVAVSLPGLSDSLNQVDKQ